MLNKFDRANALEILRLTKAGSAIPDQVRAAARRVIEGTGSAQDAQLLRQSRGISRSGAGKLRGEFSKITGIAAPIQKIEQDLENVANVTTRGGNPIAAVARLGQDVARGVEDYLKNKAIKNVAESVAKRIFGTDPKVVGEVFLSMRRTASKFAAYAAPIGFAAEVGWRIGSKVAGIQQVIDRRNESAGVSFDASRGIKANTADFAVQAAMIRQRVRDSRGLYDRSSDFVTRWAAGMWNGEDPDNFDYASTNAEEDRQIGIRQKNQVRARSLAPSLIDNPAALLAEEARKKGKTVQELTDREVNTVLDRQNRHLLSGEENVPDWSSPPDRLKTWVQKQSVAYKAKLATMTYDQIQKEFQRVYEEQIVPEILSGKEEQRERARENAENTREAMFNTPEKRAAFRESIAISQANYQAEFARHKAVEYD